MEEGKGSWKFIVVEGRGELGLLLPPVMLRNELEREGCGDGCCGVVTEYCELEKSSSRSSCIASIPPM